MANSSFFRSIEESSPTTTRQAEAEPDDWEDNGQEPAEDFDETELDSAFEEDETDYQDDDGSEEQIDSVESAPQARSSAGAMAMILGWLVGGAGLVLTLLGIVMPDSVATIISSLAEAQVHPIHLIVVGAVLGVYGSLRRELTHRAANDTLDLTQLDIAIERMEAAANEQRERREEEELSDSERLLLALERQDGKINNLTRATKLYGKPLVEISKQVSELTAQIQDLDGMGPQAEKLQQDISDELSMHWEETAKKIESGFSSHDNDVGDSFEQQNAKLAELSKMLEGQGRPLAEFSNQIATINDRMDELSKSVTGLQSNLESTQSSSVDLTPIESRMTDLHKQMQTLARQVETIASRPAPTPTAGDTASTTPQSAAPRPNAPQPEPAPPSTASQPTANSGLAHSISGKREAKGANVLGAIAKLKSMRG